jgi:hypothetical protein
MKAIMVRLALAVGMRIAESSQDGNPEQSCAN